MSAPNIAFAQIADGVQDTDYPTDYWAADYFQGYFGTPGSGSPNDKTGSGGNGTPIWQGEAFIGVGTLGLVTSQSNGSKSNGKWLNGETPTDPNMPPGYVGGTWSDGNPHYEIQFRREARFDGTLRLGYDGSTSFDDTTLVYKNGTLQYAYWPGSPSAPNRRIISGNPSFLTGYEFPVNAGDEILVVFQNWGGEGGYVFGLQEVPADPSITKSVTNNADEDGSGTVTVGDTLTYTVTATNNANASLSNFTVSDTKISPSSKVCSTVAASGGTCVLTGTYQVLPGDLVAGNVVNTASVTSPEIQTPDDPAKSIDVTLTTPIGAAFIFADLSISKTNTPGINGEVDQTNDTVTSGQNSTYTLVATNNGPDSVTGAVVKDTPTSGLTCAGTNTVSLAGDGVPAGTFTIADLTGAGIALGTLTDGQSTTLTFSCEVN